MPLPGPQSLYPSPGSLPEPVRAPGVTSPSPVMDESKPSLVESRDLVSAILLDDWATTSEADLSQSLSRIMSQPPAHPPLVMESPLTMKLGDHEDAMMDTRMPSLPSSWPPIKTEASIFNCIDPMEIQVLYHHTLH